MQNIRIAIAASLLLLCASASAHFTLDSPPAASASPGKGPPPCGPDVEDGTATPVLGGSQLMLSVNETTRHGGFYRVALALTSCRTAGCFPADNKVYDSSNQLLSPTGPGVSDHADFSASPEFPVLADNLFPHQQTGMPERYMAAVQLPNVDCDRCTLQVIEFMEPHAANPDGAGFFYHHCAELKITADPSKPLFTPGSGGGSGQGASAGGGAAGFGGLGGASGSAPIGTGGLGGTLLAGGSSSAGFGGAESRASAEGGGSGSGGSGGSEAQAGGVAATAAPDSGGCSVALHHPSGSSFLLLLLSAAVAALRRARPSPSRTSRSD